jgi:Rrf2 family transcriptional regulator, iron-sulfur cluster assembly transcription factor
MIYSRSAEYAIRAFVFLAAVPAGKYAMVKQIADESDIPSHFLAKILQQLARQGFLRSSKGPTGGFALRYPAPDINLLQIVEAIDGLADYQRCIGGMMECNDQMRCGMHDSWKALRSRIIEYLEGTSVEDLAKALEQKRRVLDKQKRGRRAPEKSVALKRL